MSRIDQSTFGAPGRLAAPCAPNPTAAPSSSEPPSSGLDRRKRRSEDTITALHYQLSAARSAGKLDALVLVDDRGCLVAGAGAWPVCEELAAYAPLLVDLDAATTAALGTRIADLSAQVEVRALPLGAAEALLASRGGGPDRSSFVTRAAVGCQRIFRAA